MHVYVTRFYVLNALLFRDLVRREAASEDNRISLLMLVWGMAPFPLYFRAVQKLIHTIRNAYQDDSFYSSLMGSCPNGFDTFLFKKLALYLFLMDSRDLSTETISWLNENEKERSDLLDALRLLEKNLQAIHSFDVC